MKKLIILILLVFSVVILRAGDIAFETQWFRLALNEKGFVTSLFDKTNDKEYLPADKTAALLNIRCNDTIEEPQQVRQRRECVGVVHNKDFAVGIQALKVKTLGGYPSEEGYIEPSYDIFATGNYKGC